MDGDHDCHQKSREKERLMAAVMIGVDPHKGSHTTLAIDEWEAR
jgi:hypothetical protein